MKIVNRLACVSCDVGVEDAQVEELFSLDDTLLDDLKLVMRCACMCMYGRICVRVRHQYTCG